MTKSDERGQSEPVGYVSEAGLQALKERGLVSVYRSKTKVCNRGLFTEPTAEAAEVKKLREVIEWYGEQARLARLIHSEGDAGRNALAADGGKRAREALGQEPK